MKQKNMAMPQVIKLVNTLKADSNKKIVGVLEGFPKVLTVRVNKGVPTIVNPFGSDATGDWNEIKESLFWVKMNNPSICMWVESL